MLDQLLGANHDYKEQGGDSCSIAHLKANISIVHQMGDHGMSHIVRAGKAHQGDNILPAAKDEVMDIMART